MLVNLVALLPKPWHELIDLKLLEDISKKLADDFIPSKDSIFRCLELDPSEVKVVIPVSYTHLTLPTSDLV